VHGPEGRAHVERGSWLARVGALQEAAYLERVAAIKRCCAAWVLKSRTQFRNQNLSMSESWLEHVRGEQVLPLICKDAHPSRGGGTGNGQNVRSRPAR
jgi:hypothetical protein